MTEAEWLGSAEPRWMLRLLTGKASRRKQGMFALTAFSHGERLLVSRWEPFSQLLRNALTKFERRIEDATIHGDRIPDPDFNVRLPIGEVPRRALGP